MGNDDINESNVSQIIELMFKGDLHCFQGCFRKQTGKEDVETCEPETRGLIMHQFIMTQS